MELELARKISELELDEIEKILRSFRREDDDAYKLLKEVVEDAL
jgi:hypothetical protein